MRLRLGVVFGFVAGGALWAAEPAPSSANSGDGISAAKRDFDAVKASRDKALLPKDDLPQMSVPDLQMGDSDFVLSQRRKREEMEREAKTKKKSSNWLIEAMEKSDPKKESSTKGGEKADEFARLLAGPKESGEAKVTVAPPASPAKDEKDAKKAEPSPNPLNQFLTDWMTPKDYALLKPGLQSSGASAATLPAVDNAKAGSTVSIDLPGAKNDNLGGLLTPEHAPVFAAKSAENPFLQGLNEPAPFAGLTPPPSLPAPAMTQPLTTGPSIFSSAPPPPSPAPPTKVPDFVKPAGDDKYFKPLKRF